MCIVCDGGEEDEASRKIYGEWLLGRTNELLSDTISLPKDISPLVQETYRDMKEGEGLYLEWVEQMEKQKIKENRAKQHRIIREKELEETMHGLLDHDVGNKESDAQARVRDGEPSIPVLLMVRLKNGNAGFLPWQSQGEKIPMDHVPSEDESKKILLQKVQLPRALSVYRFHECVEQLESQNREYLEEWHRSRWLQGELILLLEEDLTTELCGSALKYSRQYGLVCEKEG
jgi:CRISPR-associated endonuclease/helicase Cas3